MFHIKIFQILFVLMGFYVITGISACDFPSEEKDGAGEEVLVFSDTLTVTASAYNSLKLQGEGNASITAYGDTLVPGMKSIAVSRDLVRKGLTHGTPVVIEGFEGLFIVNDKMHQRWRNKIDIYMGIDKEKAMEWGRKKVKISFPGQEQTEVE